MFESEMISSFAEFSIADVDLALMLQRLLRSGDVLPERPRAYAEEIWRRPAIREWVDHPRPAAERKSPPWTGE
jgi:glutathione S-transferase